MTAAFVAPAPQTVSSRPGLIVLIDDNQADNLYHQLVLEAAMPETRVVVLSGGRDALRYLTPFRKSAWPKPDLILVDLNMPAMTGWEFIDQYDERTASDSNRPVLIVLSTTENPEDIERAKAHTAVDGFLSKPLDEDKLFDLVADYFGR